MTAQEQASKAGVTLAEITAITGTARSTLNDWHKNKPKLFEVVLIGCASKIELETNK